MQDHRIVAFVCLEDLLQKATIVCQVVMLARRKRWRQEPVQADNHPAKLVGGEATERLHDVALAGGKALKTWLCAGRSGQLQVQTLHGSLAPKVNLAQDLIPPACVSALFVGLKLAAFSLTEQTVILPRSLETMAVVPVELEKGALTKPIMTLQVFGPYRRTRLTPVVEAGRDLLPLLLPEA